MTPDRNAFLVALGEAHRVLSLAAPNDRPAAWRAFLALESWLRPLDLGCVHALGRNPSDDVTLLATLRAVQSPTPAEADQLYALLAAWSNCVLKWRNPVVSRERDGRPRR